MRATAVLVACVFALALFARTTEAKPLPRHGRCLSLPLKTTIVVTFGFHDPNHPFLKKYGPHEGIDIEADVGTSVVASATGVVVWSGLNKYGTNVVDISLPGGWKLRYGHLSRIFVKRGDRIRRGAKIGLSGGAVGAWGSGQITTGAHLHFELIDGREDKTVDPMPFLCQQPQE